MNSSNEQSQLLFEESGHAPLTAQSMEPNLLYSSRDSESTDVHTCLEIEESPESGVNTARSYATPSGSTQSVLTARELETIRSLQDVRTAVEILSEMSRSENVLCEAPNRPSDPKLHEGHTSGATAPGGVDIQKIKFLLAQIVQLLGQSTCDSIRTAQSPEPNMLSTRTAQSVEPNLLNVYSTRDLTTMLKARSPEVVTAQPLEPNLLSVRTAHSSSSGSSLRGDSESTDVQTCLEIEEFPESEFNTARSFATSSGSTPSVLTARARSSSSDSSLHGDSESTDVETCLEIEESTESGVSTVCSSTTSSSSATSSSISVISSEDESSRSSMDEDMEPFNWSGLPMEMKFECMKHMDFETRMKLKATARLEKSIVESKKILVETVSIQSCFDESEYMADVLIDKNSELFEDGYFESIEKVLSLVTSLIKYTKISRFIFGANCMTRNFNRSIEIFETITAGGHFKIPFVGVEYLNDHDFHSLFEILPRGTRVFNFHHTPKRGFKRVCRDPETLPLMLGASILQCVFRERHLVDSIIEAWLRNDQVVGKKVILLVDYYIGKKSRDYRPIKNRIFSDFKNRWESRVVKDDEEFVRISMDDSSKHILLRMLKEHGETEEKRKPRDTLVLALWETVPADLMEENFSKSAGWAHRYI